MKPLDPQAVRWETPPEPPRPETAAFEVHRPERPSRLLVLCDHATNQIPDRLGDLGLPPAERTRHIAYDIGARGVAIGLARALGGVYLGSTFSRLVIDPNRSENDPTLIMRLYDRTIIPGNARMDGDERARRLEAHHRAYHGAIEREMASIAAAAGAAPILISIHSYTAQLRGRPPRPWHAGVLWDRDPKTAQALLDLLRSDPDLVVGDNEPYKGALPGDTMDRHGNATGAPHALVEVRNDLIETVEGQRAWAARLAGAVSQLDGVRRDA